MNIITWKYALQDTETAVHRKWSLKMSVAVSRTMYVICCLNIRWQYSTAEFRFKVTLFSKISDMMVKYIFYHFFQSLVKFTVTRRVPIITPNEICMHVTCARYLI